MNTLTAPNGRKPKLAVFDVEGVLIPKNRLFFDVARSLSVIHLVKALFFGFLYQLGVLPLRRALTRIFRVMKGAPVDLLYQKLDRLPVSPDAASVFSILKAQGCKTALVSSGLPTFLVEKLASKVGADYAVGVEVGIEGGLLTGEVWGDVVESNGKFLILKELMDDAELTAADCVVVADDRNNASLFLRDALKIGFNPDFIIRIKADAVVGGSLTKILPVVNGEYRTKNQLSSNDFLRELTHGSGIFIPILALLFGVPAVAVFIVAVIAVYSVSELARIRGKNVPFFSAMTRHAASQSELCHFTTAPVYFGVGILLTLLLIPPPASYGGIAIFCLGDSVASLLGGTLTKRPLPFNGAKTLEGSLSGFFFAFLAGAVFVSPLAALLAAAIGMIVEFLPLPVNDNLLIPLFAGLTLMFLL